MSMFRYWSSAEMTGNNILSFGILAVIFLLETIFPFRKGYLRRFRHLSRNSALAIINAFITGIFSAFVSASVFLWAKSHSIGFLRMLSMPERFSFFAAFILFDMWMYSWHRAAHRIPFLWRFHKVHHNDPEIDFSTTLRFHPVEIIISSFLNIGIIVAAGISLEQLVLYKMVFRLSIFFHHSNIALPEYVDRVYRLLFVSPNMHRVHHSTERAETDSNYASVFSFWDRIFGTYKERDTQKIVYGLRLLMDEKWQTVNGLLTLPFK